MECPRCGGRLRGHDRLCVYCNLSYPRLASDVQGRLAQILGARKARGAFGLAVAVAVLLPAILLIQQHATHSPTTSAEPPTRVPIPLAAPASQPESTPGMLKPRGSSTRATVRRLTGAITESASLTAPGMLTAINGTDADAVVVLTTLSGRTVVSGYVRAHETVRLYRIPDGHYWLFFGFGEDWDPIRRKFTRNATHERFEDTLSYQTWDETDGFRYSEQVVTLHAVVEGNAGTIHVPAEQFPAV